MAFFSGTIYSKAMNMDTMLSVVLPQDSRKHRGVEPIHAGIEPFDVPKTFILLHGLSDNHNAWAHRTSILRYAEDFGVAVIMPEVQRSFYQNMKHGPSYFAYITEELPELASKLFHISVAPEDMYIAGLSMGGYGALACALSYPQRYKAAGAFSGVCDLKSTVLDETFASRTELNGWVKDRTAIFGDPVQYPEHMDLHVLANKVARQKVKPAVYMACGIEDFLYEQNVEMKSHFEKLNFNFLYEEWHGVHEWGFWDKAVQRMFEHFLIDHLSTKEIEKGE